MAKTEKEKPKMGNVMTLDNKGRVRDEFNLICGHARLSGEGAQLFLKKGEYSHAELVHLIEILKDLESKMVK